MTRKRSKLDLMITAIHEAGHAVAAYQLGYMPTLVTIRARGENRGCTHYRSVRIHPNEDATSQRRKTEHAIMIADRRMPFSGLWHQRWQSGTVDFLVWRHREDRQMPGRDPGALFHARRKHGGIGTGYHETI